MGPRPYSERSSLPDPPNNLSSELLPTQIVGDSPTPPTLSAATTPSPIPQEVNIIAEQTTDNVDIQEEGIPAEVSAVPCYPTPDDIMPYDHSLPDFIRQITNQPNLQNLHKLSLRVVSRLISLQRMSMYIPNLRELDLEGSMLTSLRDIGCNLKYLQVLKVGRCQLDSLDGTFGLASLRELYAQKNFITDVSPCSNLPHIRHIDVSNNRIRNISYAGFLAACPKLRSVIFTGNPATDVDGYREHVRRILPQIEILDDVPFLNEDNCSYNREPDYIENCGERSDSSSVDYVSIKSTDSMSNLYESEDDAFIAEQPNKRVKNVMNRECFESTDYEVQELFAGGNNKYDLENDFDLLSINKKDDKILNTRRKSASAEKHNKDVENRSKKSNLSNGDLDDYFSAREQSKDESQFYSPLKDQILLSNARMRKCERLFGDLSDSDDSCSIRASVSLQSDDFRSLEEITALSPTPKEKKAKEDREKDIKDIRPSTTNGIINSNSSHSGSSSSASNSGVIKKRPSTAAPKLVIRDSDDEDDEEVRSAISCGASKLTTGLPVCGNLTASLRNRKKHQTAWEEKETSKTKRSEPLILIPKDKSPIQVQLNGSGDASDQNTSIKSGEDIIAEDVLASSKKWREAFRRFRSNNRARWEEEDKMDYSHLMGNTAEENISASYEADVSSNIEE